MARLALLATCLVGVSAQAETHLLSNSKLAAGGGTGTSILPTGWSQQGWTTDSTGTHQMGPCPFAYLCVYAAPQTTLKIRIKSPLLTRGLHLSSVGIDATECWNEPSANPAGFFNGTGTQLADICKAIYTATKGVNSAMPVICPASDLSWVLPLKTSQGEPLHQFCDWVDDHPYDSTGPARDGYSAQFVTLNGIFGMWCRRSVLCLWGMAIRRLRRQHPAGRALPRCTNAGALRQRFDTQLRRGAATAPERCGLSG